ncbi:hypothetical protein [Variovorax ginsengisoli]|uniref:Alkanesulfonate monooxygenase SsuD/methylene tetrahydromethanopterin reductase-like flavin-dependent oxidoreductase (Luciferase family) n=1 Tax=Variovorax ginsengisoli TaxID=363844 RepID=A0ABT9S4C0_9BURK|nr:hypothetical protein [Variovorax ginsengisoli]MDP9898759.1 alkanesulfonate monooxygenase SsuD/methylene tetrahydromethanopterin reductase-like flavin-dependent oxidoreductase (luciferase family) [Variovorax ginsengisoli]
MSSLQRLGFFSRLLDDASAGERYRLVTAQIVHAEALGYDSAWVAQHHFHAAEGGLPSPLVQGGDRLYPSSPQLLDRIWQASFSVVGGTRAGLAGDGLMLSRTQPRTAEVPNATLAELQLPIIEAYLAALPAGRAPRIVGSRSVFVADDRALARRLAEEGLRRSFARQAGAAASGAALSLDALIARQDVHVGTPSDVIASLRADRTLAQVTDLVCQVHSVDPPHRHILRSIELIATEVAPALGWPGPATSRASSLTERFTLA